MRHDANPTFYWAQEYAAWLAGQKRPRYSDGIDCQSSMIGVLINRLDKTMPDEFRPRLRPLVARSLGTADDGRDVERAFMCADRAVRVFAPMALEASGHRAEADLLRRLGTIEDVRTAREAHKATSDAGGEGHSRCASFAARCAVDAAAYAPGWSASDRRYHLKRVAVIASLAAVLVGLVAYAVAHVAFPAPAHTAGLAVAASAGVLAALVCTVTGYCRAPCQAADFAADAAIHAAAVADSVAVWQTALDMVETLLPEEAQPTEQHC